MIRFITGTDTGVGKTVVATALARSALAEGRSVTYCKPVQTGAEPDQPGDAAFVHATTGIPVEELLRFPATLAPAVAAELAGTPIDTAMLTADILALASTTDVLIVEGAGGILVPLSGPSGPSGKVVTMADLARDLDATVVIACRPSLGTLNHTALTLEAASHRRLRVEGLVISNWPTAPGLTERTNLEQLRSMAPVLGVVPTIQDLDTEGQVPPKTGDHPPRLEPPPDPPSP